MSGWSPLSVSQLGGSVFGSPTSTGTGSTSHSSSGSVVGAFKELQHTARAVERGRAEAYKQRDELRRLLSEQRRHQALSRSKNESLSNEPILAVRRNCEVVKAALQDAHGKLYAHEAELRVAQEEENVKTERLCALEQELADEHSKHMRLVRRTHDLETQLEQVDKRFEVLTQRHQQLSVSAAEAKMRALDQVNVCKIEAKQTLDAAARAQLRSKATSDYINMILGVNNDLVCSLEQQSQAAAQLERFIIVPRYRWPKGQMTGALQLVATAATDSMYQARGAASVPVHLAAGGRRSAPIALGAGRRVEINKPRGGRRRRSLAKKQPPLFCLAQPPTNNSSRSSRGHHTASDEIFDADGALSAADFLNALVHSSNTAKQRQKSSARRLARVPFQALPSYMRPKSY